MPNMMRAIIPILTILVALVGVWYAAALPMNFRLVLDQIERDQLARQNQGQAQAILITPATAPLRREMGVFALILKNPAHIISVYDASTPLDRPRLPLPHQVASEFWRTTGKMVQQGRTWSKRSLIYHAWVTLTSTFFGFALGVTIGLLGALSITYFRVAELSLMPWAIISQTIPIVALAPMIIVLSGQIGIENRLFPKALISAYLCFFPILISMVKGLRSPSPEQLDLLKTYNASATATCFKLRIPSSTPYFFTSLKVGIAAALVGTIVGELPTGAISGLGARILIGDQFGTPLAIWSALLMAAILAGILVTITDIIQRFTLHKLGWR